MEARGEPHRLNARVPMSAAAAGLSSGTAAALAAAAQGAPLVFGHAAPDAVLLIGVERPFEALG